jgi:hypothetical protein
VRAAAAEQPAASGRSASWPAPAADARAGALHELGGDRMAGFVDQLLGAVGLEHGIRLDRELGDDLLRGRQLVARLEQAERRRQATFSVQAGQETGRSPRRSLNDLVDRMHGLGIARIPFYRSITTRAGFASMVVSVIVILLRWRSRPVALGSGSR